jgi:hypothetical protein
MSSRILRIGDLVDLDGYTNEFYFKKPRIQDTHPGVVLIADSNRLYVHTLGAIVILTPAGDKLRVDVEDWGRTPGEDSHVYFYNSDYERVKDVPVTIDDNHNPRLLEEIREILAKQSFG